MKEPTEKESTELVQAYHANSKAFEALYDDGCFPPLSYKIMERLRRGIGSLDEVTYYQQTQWGREDLENLLSEEEKNSPPPKRGRIGRKPKNDDDEDVPF